MQTNAKWKTTLNRINNWFRRVLTNRMFRYVLKRILLMFLTLFIIMTMCFILVKLLPMITPRENGKDINLIYARREKMGYNKPILVQYWLFVKGVVTEWDWGVGEQMYDSLEVWDIMMQKLPYTVLVNLYSILIAIPLGLGFGIYAALKKNKWQDHLISTMVMVFISVPSYVYAFLIQYFFSGNHLIYTVYMSQCRPYAHHGKNNSQKVKVLSFAER